MYIRSTYMLYIQISFMRISSSSLSPSECITRHFIIFLKPTSHTKPKLLWINMNYIVHKVHFSVAIVKIKIVYIFGNFSFTISYTQPIRIKFYHLKLWFNFYVFIPPNLNSISKLPARYSTMILHILSLYYSTILFSFKFNLQQPTSFIYFFEFKNFGIIIYFIFHLWLFVENIIIGFYIKILKYIL